MVEDAPPDAREQLEHPIGGDGDADIELEAIHDPALGRAAFWAWLGQALTAEIARRRGTAIVPPKTFTGSDLMDADLGHLAALTKAMGEAGATAHHRFFAEVAAMLGNMVTIRRQNNAALKELLASW